jgi:hypothetical protein
VRARTVIANLVPADRAALVEGEQTRRGSTRWASRVDEGWGAAMLYLGAARDAGSIPRRHHLELVGDAARPFTEGNHVFVSLGAARRDRPRRPAARAWPRCRRTSRMRTIRALPREAQGRTSRRAARDARDLIAARSSPR